MFDPRVVGTGTVITANHSNASVTDDDTGSITINPGALAYITVRDGAANGGTPVADLSVTADDIRHARAVNEQMIETLQHFDPRRFTALNQEFHSALFTKCANPRMLELVNAEWARLGHLRESTFSFVPGRAQESVREHENILKLIEAGAPLSEIEKAARRHRSATLDAYMIHEHPDEALSLPAF